MINHWQRSLLNIFICIIISSDIYGQVVMTNPSVKQPVTLAEAQAEYIKNNTQKNEGLNFYYAMAGYFLRIGWYDRCVDECNDILKKWPDDKKEPLYIGVIGEKSNALAALKRWPEAYDNFDSYYQRHKEDQ